MLYRTLPRGTEPLSVLGYGCMRFPTQGRAIDERKATTQLLKAVDLGVNYFDTAIPYHGGASEPFLGKVVADNNLRDRVNLATKLPPWLVRSRQDMDRLLDVQLRNLRTDRIDYYLIHSLAGSSWARMMELGVLEFLDRARKQGKIRFAGFSFHGRKDEFPPIVDARDWDFCQIQYNLLDEFNQAGTAGLEYAAQKGLGVMVMEPLRGGNLGRRPPDSVQAFYDAAPVKRSPAEWALRWLWNRPEITLVLSGMNIDEHVLENCRVAAEGKADSLSDLELEMLGKATAAYRHAMKSPCTGCQYCMPCPARVDIPGCFEIWNNFHTFGDPNAKTTYLVRISGLLGAPGRASQCTDCGKCEKACPQHIPIRSHLRGVVADFEGPGLTLKFWISRFYLKFQRLWTMLRHHPDS